MESSHCVRYTDTVLLQTISFCNYRCFAHIDDLPLESITAFIGPNDSGKSSILLLLDHVFHNRPLPESDFRHKDRPIVVEMLFYVTRAHEAAKAQAFMRSTNELRVKKTFEVDKKPLTWVYKRCYEDERLDRLDKLSLVELQGVAGALGVEDRPKLKADLLARIRAHLATHPVAMCDDWVQVDSGIDAVLPEYLIFRADEDLSLQNSPVVTTLREAYKRFLREESLDEVERILDRAKDKLRDVLSGLTPNVQRFAGTTVELVIDPTLDLANSLNIGEISVRTGASDAQKFAGYGDGTKRRIMLGVFHWSKGVLAKLAEEEPRPLLWGFDEPDTHLHYQAQYELLANIKGLAADKMQVLICTHSIPIIDHLSPQAIRQMMPDRDDRSTNIEYLRTDGADVELFLKDVGQGIGFANSLLFYERCFIVVEGPTEEKALPIIYRTLFGRDLIEDGIRLFAAESNSSALMLARLLHLNKKEVVVLLDRDTHDAPTMRTHLRRLGECAFLVDERIVYIGAREFEDAFSNDALLLCLNAHYPRAAGPPWEPDDIDRFRYNEGAEEFKKFSWAFLEVHVAREARRPVTKPEFGRQLATCIEDDDLIPAEIKQLFGVVRRIAGPL